MEFLDLTLFLSPTLDPDPDLTFNEAPPGPGGGGSDPSSDLETVRDWEVFGSVTVKGARYKAKIFGKKT